MERKKFRIKNQKKIGWKLKLEVRHQLQVGLTSLFNHTR